MVFATAGLAYWLWPEGGAAASVGGTMVKVTWVHVTIATVVGLLTGIAVGVITSYYCSMDKPPVDRSLSSRRPARRQHHRRHRCRNAVHSALSFAS